MGDTYAFALPVTMAGFGCAFLVLWRWRARSALLWSLGFFLGAAGFSAGMLNGIVPERVLPVLADTVFLVSFFCYGQALWTLMGRRGMVAVRVGICGVSLAISNWAVGIGSLRGELLANDLACALLLGLPLVRVRHLRRRPVDKALLVASALVVLDNLHRVAMVAITSPGSMADFGSSDYAFVMRATATVLALVFALTALAALVHDLVDRYRQQAFTDALSGLLNRRGFEETVALRRQERTGSSIVTCDIDHFKRINDALGHAAGDGVIVALAAILRDALPAGGVAARFGGEEFVVYLPECGAAGAKAFAEGVRARFSSSLREMPLTASFGISGTLPGDFSIHEAIARADAALYEAKNAGRDRVCVKLAALPGYAATTSGKRASLL